MSLEDINNNYESDIENTNTQNEDTQNEDIQNSYNDFDFESVGMIPCELCQTMVNFEDYNDHITMCIGNYNLRRERFDILNGFLNILNASENLTRGNNNNTNLIPRDDENINERDEIPFASVENDINEQNPGNENIEDVNNNVVNSEEGDVTNADNADNENNDDTVDPFDSLLRNFVTINRRSSVSPFSSMPLMLPNTENILWSTNIGRRIINDIEINIGNLHNLTQDNNATAYDFNLLIQRLMGGNVEIGVKDFNKTIKVLNIEEINDNDICTICLDNLKNLYNSQSQTDNSIDQSKINVPVKTTCGHLYCRECIFKWLTKNKSCPVCKFEFENNENNENINNLENENINNLENENINNLENENLTDDSDENYNNYSTVNSIIDYSTEDDSQEMNDTDSDYSTENET